jgi:hypothetical protein
MEVGIFGDFNSIGAGQNILYISSNDTLMNIFKNG